MSNLKYIPLLLLLMPSVATGQTSGAVLIGQGAGTSPKYTLLSQDCTNTAAGVVTCGSAGAGAGPFAAGSLGIGTTADGVTGDIEGTGALMVGPLSIGLLPAAGNVIIDNAFTCNNAGVATGVSCLNINSGAGYTGMEMGFDNVGNFLIGVGGALGSPTVIFNASSSGSIQFKSTANLLGAAVESQGLGSSMRLISGSVLTMTGGTLPTLTTCNGAGSVVGATSTPNRGQFTTQTAGCSTATVHFAQTMPQKMYCVCGDGNATITPVACSYDFVSSSTTQAVFDFVNQGAAYKYDYVCE